MFSLKAFYNQNKSIPGEVYTRKQDRLSKATEMRDPCNTRKNRGRKIAEKREQEGSKAGMKLRYQGSITAQISMNCRTIVSLLLNSSTGPWEKYSLNKDIKHHPLYFFLKLTESNEIFRKDFVCIHHHRCKI